MFLLTLKFSWVADYITSTSGRSNNFSLLKLISTLRDMAGSWVFYFYSPTTGKHQVCPREGGHTGLQKWSTNTDTQLAPTWEVCGASARDMLVHWAGWPVGVSEDLRAKLHVLGETEAAWGSRSSTARENLRPWGPHITSGLNKVSPATAMSDSLKHYYLDFFFFLQWRKYLIGGKNSLLTTPLQQTGVAKMRGSI